MIKYNINTTTGRYEGVFQGVVKIAEIWQSNDALKLWSVAWFNTNGEHRGRDGYLNYASATRAVRNARQNNLVGPWVAVSNTTAPVEAPVTETTPQANPPAFN